MTDEDDRNQGQNMTENFSHSQTLFFELDRKFTTPTNINLTPKKYAGADGLDRSLSPGQQAHTGWDT